MNNEEVLATLEAEQLLDSIADSCEPNNPYYQAQLQIRLTRGLSLALLKIVARQDFSRLDLAQLTFGLGVYMGLQYKQMEKLEGKK